MTNVIRKLEVGHIFDTRDKSRYLVLNKDMAVSINRDDELKVMRFKGYKQDLTCMNNPDKDVMVIYNKLVPSKSFEDVYLGEILNADRDQAIIWQRKEDKQDIIEDDLRELMFTGRCVVLRNGRQFLVLRDIHSRTYGLQEWALVNYSRYRVGEEYNKNLEHETYKSNDVMEIYQLSTSNEYQLSGNIFDFSNYTHLVWRRED